MPRRHNNGLTGRGEKDRFRIKGGGKDKDTAILQDSETINSLAVAEPRQDIKKSDIRNHHTDKIHG